VAGEMDEVVMAPQATDEGGLRKVLDAVAVGAGSPAPAEAARSVALQLAAAVSGNGEGKFEIQLSPEELGRVTVTMQVTDDAVVLVVQAERQETLDLMRRHADILQREFREAGFTTLNFSFGQGGHDGRSPRLPAEPSGFEDLAAGPPALRSVHEGGRVAASSRLDLRL
jgi:flagellar hook-length control protein FliK